MAGKHYTDEFKKGVVHLYINGKPIEEIECEYGISRSAFYGWLRKYREIRISENEVMTADDIAALQKKVAKLEEENLCVYIEELDRDSMRADRPHMGIQDDKGRKRLQAEDRHML